MPPNDFLKADLQLGSFVFEFLGFELNFRYCTYVFFKYSAVAPIKSP